MKGQTQGKETFSLLEAPEGRKVRVVTLATRGATFSKLCSLGFTPGTVVEVCSASQRAGSCRVRLRGGPLVLDAGLAGVVECLEEAS